MEKRMTTGAEQATSGYRKWIYLAALSLIWGSSYILIKKGLLGFGYLESSTIRLMVAGVVFLPWGINSARKIPSGKLWWVALSAMLSMFVPAYLFSLSQQHIASSLAGILIATTPVCTFAISVFLFRQKYSTLQIAGLLTGLTCCIVLSLQGTGNPGMAWNGYALLIILAALCYGFNINIVKRYLADVPSLHVSSVSVSLNGIVAFVCVFLPRQGQFGFSEAPAISLVALITLGVLGTAIAQWLNTRLIHVSSPLFASAITYLIPIIAMGWGLLDGEVLGIVHFVVVAGILFSISLIRRGTQT